LVNLGTGIDEPSDDELILDDGIKIRQGEMTMDRFFMKRRFVEKKRRSMLETK